MAFTTFARSTLLALASVAAPTAIGAPVVFNNTSPGFAWRAYGACSGDLITGEYLFLDVTLPAQLQPLSDENQNNCFGRPPHTVSLFIRPNGLNNPDTVDLSTLESQAISFSAPFDFQIFGNPGFPIFSVTPPRVYTHGQTVGPSADWTPDTSFTSLRYEGSGASGVPLATGSGAWGFRFTLSGQTHYAFIAYKLYNNGVWIPTTWGYESQPNTPIAVVVPACISADLNNDRVVNVNDLTVFLGSFGSTGPAHYSADINGDLAVNTVDLVALLANFGCSG